MNVVDITFAIFSLCNSFRVLAYVPQIAKAHSDKDGAKAISLSTWALFLVSHLSGAAYACINQADWAMCCVFLSNAAGSMRDLVNRKHQSVKLSKAHTAQHKIVRLVTQGE